MLLNGVTPRVVRTPCLTLPSLCVWGYRTAGYSTHFAGEWALSALASQTPTSLESFGFDEWLTPDIVPGSDAMIAALDSVQAAETWLQSRRDDDAEAGGTRPFVLVVVLGSAVWQAPAWRGEGEHSSDSAVHASNAHDEGGDDTVDTTEFQVARKWRRLASQLFEPAGSGDGDDGTSSVPGSWWHDGGARRVTTDAMLHRLQLALPTSALVRAR